MLADLEFIVNLKCPCPVKESENAENKMKKLCSICISTETVTSKELKSSIQWPGKSFSTLETIQ